MLVGIITFLECLRLLRCDNVTIEKLLIIYYARAKFEIVESLPSTYGRVRVLDEIRQKTQTNNAVADVEVVAISCKQETQMVYTYGYAQPASAAFDYFTIACNDMFDLDRTTLGKLGNKQPTFLTLFYQYRAI